MIGAVLDRVRTSGADGTKGKSLAVQEHIRCPLRRYYRDLMRKHGFPGPNPAADLKDYMSGYPSKRARQGGYTYFRQEEGPQLFGTCAGAFPRWLPFIGCCTLAGLRWGEAAALEWTDLDFAKRVLHVQRTMSDKARLVKPTKDKEDRYVPMSATLAGWLQEHRERMALEGSLAEWTPEQRALVFPNRVGRIGGYSAFLEHTWGPLLAKAGLRYRKPHSMRHTFATWALEGNAEKGVAPVPIHHVRDWLGHASVEETERYLHVEYARHARAVDGLDAYVL
jgi:integrase